MEPFKWQESRKIPTLKPTSRSSPKYVDHISVGSCVAIPEDFVVNHRSNPPPRPGTAAAKKTAVRPVHVASNKPHFSARTSSLQKMNQSATNNDADNTNTTHDALSTPPSRSLPSIPQQPSHSRYPSTLIPIEIKDEIKVDKDWATNLLNDAFNM